MSSTRNEEQELAIVGGQSKIRGSFQGGNFLIVEGEFAGSIQCQELVITRRGKIEAWVEVENMEVWGEVNGFSRVKKVICRKTSRIGGCIMGGGIALEPGVVIEGALAFEKAEDVENEGKESS